MINNYKFQFVTEYTVNGVDYHQCFEVFHVPNSGESPEKIKADSIENIKTLIRSHGCLLTRLWIAYSELTVFELQELTDGKLPKNCKGQFISLEEISI